MKHEPLSNYTLIDLTHAIDDTVPTWDGSCGFNLTIDGDSDHSKFQLQSFRMQAGLGTHMDSPCHYIKGGLSISDIPLKCLMIPLVVIDVSTHADENYEINLDDVSAFEKAHGIITAGSLVIGYTGWSRYWNDPVLYRNADSNGRMHFPSFNEKVAELLLQRNVSGIAIDTLSPDIGMNGYFPVHEIILGSGKYLVENVANAHLLPPVGAYGIVLPLKISGGAESAVRFIALV